MKGESIHGGKRVYVMWYILSLLDPEAGVSVSLIIRCLGIREFLVGWRIVITRRKRTFHKHVLTFKKFKVLSLEGKFVTGLCAGIYHSHMHVNALILLLGEEVWCRDGGGFIDVDGKAPE